MCFGRTSHVASVYDLIRNAVVIAAAAVGAIYLSPASSTALAMDGTVATIAMLVLIAAVALNLFLTMRLARSVRVLQTPFSVAVGEELPYFEGRRLLGGEVVSSRKLHGQAVVLVFLAAICSACKSHIPELASILEGSHRNDVSLWIIDVDGAGRIACSYPVARRSGLPSLVPCCATRES